MEKKELQENDMEKVNGGGAAPVNYTKCPSCYYTHSDSDLFSPQPFKDGCNRKCHYTCPQCGHGWDEGE